MAYDRCRPKPVAPDTISAESAPEIERQILRAREHGKQLQLLRGRRIQRGDPPVDILGPPDRDQSIITGLEEIDAAQQRVGLGVQRLALTRHAPPGIILPSQQALGHEDVPRRDERLSADPPRKLLRYLAPKGDEASRPVPPPMPAIEPEQDAGDDRGPPAERVGSLEPLAGHRLPPGPDS